MAELWSIQEGPSDGPVVLLLHGAGVGAWMWRDQVAVLRERYRVIAPDLPGHDHSAGVPFTSSAELVEDLARLVSDQARGREVAVVGFSYGAQLALALATSHPDLVRHVIVVSALTEAMPLEAASRTLVRATAPLGRQRWFARLQARSMFVPDDLFADYLRTVRALPTRDLVGVLAANAAFRAPRTWSAYPGRALLLAGEREVKPLLRGLQALRAGLPTAELEIVPGAGHGLPLQRPTWFTTRLLDFLDPAEPR